MNKKEIINALSKMKCDIAEVICDISRGGNVIYPNESILVFLVSEPNNDDFIKNNKHWTICNSISDFKKGIVYGKKTVRKSYCKLYVSDFKKVKEFKTDFN